MAQKKKKVFVGDAVSYTSYRDKQNTNTSLAQATLYCQILLYCKGGFPVQPLHIRISFRDVGK